MNTLQAVEPITLDPVTLEFWLGSRGKNPGRIAGFEASTANELATLAGLATPENARPENWEWVGERANQHTQRLVKLCEDFAVELRQSLMGRPPPPALEKPHILVVDDEASQREVYRLILEGDGCEVTTCSDRAAALRSFQPGSHDAVILSMPVRDGRPLATQIKQQWPNIPIISYSVFYPANNTNDSNLFTTRLTKPLSLEELRKAVAKVPRRSRCVSDYQPVTLSSETLAVWLIGTAKRDYGKIRNCVHDVRNQATYLVNLGLIQRQPPQTRIDYQSKIVLTRNTIKGFCADLRALLNPAPAPQATA